MQRNIIIATLAAAASAIKTTDDSLTRQGVITQTDANMGETKTGYSYAHENLDDLQVELDEWWGEEGRPFIKQYRNMVWNASIGEAEQKYGQLLETCDEGTQCRETIMLELKAEIKEIWETKLKEIRASFKSARKESGTVVEDVWSDLVQCQIDHPCCGYNEVYWHNNVIQVTEKRQELRGYINKWAEFEARRLEIEAECPMNAWPDCPSDEISTCWDGTDRETDCSCLANPYGACPATPCKDGAKRDLETCACPDDEASDI